MGRGHGRRGAERAWCLGAAALAVSALAGTAHGWWRAPGLMADELRPTFEERPDGAHEAAGSGPMCSEQSFGGRLPVLPPAYVIGGSLLCFPSFVAWDSRRTKTPIFSAEHLTRERLAAARRVGRHEEFHEEPSLPPPEGPALADYRHSGFDRGHMTPAGDEPTELDKFDSFSIGANIVPQDHAQNGGIWEMIETEVRSLARGWDEAWVVTGPLFEGATLRTIGSGVAVPTSTWKAVYVPGYGAAVFVAPNDASGGYEIASVAEFTRRTGMDPFPGLDGQAKAAVAPFPPP